MDQEVFQLGGRAVRRPIVQGGMGVGVSLSGLAGAVAAQGGVGTISGVHPGYRDPAFAADPYHANLRAIGSELARARAIAPDGVIGFNFMTVMQHYDDYVREAIAQGADFIVSGAGLPTGLAALAGNSRTSIVPVVSSARALRLIVRRWLQAGRLPDAVVVEGPLAGGHLGFAYEDAAAGRAPSLEDCLREVLEETAALEAAHGVSIPVIAGGGVRSRADVTRLMGLGAAAVQVGTRFVPTAECDAHAAFKQAYLDAAPADVHLIHSPVGLAARAIDGPLLRRAAQGRIPVQRCYGCMHRCDPKTTPYCISQALIDAVEGREGLVFCGAGAPELHTMTTVAQVMDELAPRT